MLRKIKEESTQGSRHLAIWLAVDNTNDAQPYTPHSVGLELGPKVLTHSQEGHEETRRKCQIFLCDWKNIFLVRWKWKKVFPRRKKTQPTSEVKYLSIYLQKNITPDG